MARGRMIDKNIRKSKKFRDLKNDKSRLLYLMIYPHVDRDGRFTADPEEIKIECIPYLNYSNRQIAESIVDMYNVGLINLGTHNNEPYLEITRFRDFNNIREDREGDSKYPELGGSRPGVVQEYSSLINISLKEVNERINEDKKKQAIYYDSEKIELINISEKQKEAWKKTFPICDIEAELNKMASWLDANPKKRKSSYKAFINNWLSRTQDKGGTNKGGGSVKTFEEIEEDHRKALVEK